MKEVVLVSAARTAIGAFGGSLKNISAVKLGALVIEEVVKRAGISPSEVQEVIMGNVLQSGLGQNPARQSAIAAGIPYTASSFTVNKVCGSGLEVVNLAANSIRAGEFDVIIAGGMENMSQAPFAMESARWGMRMSDNKVVDIMIRDGLWDAFNDYHMGITAENVAEIYNITREEQDAFSLDSQHKTAIAQENGAFVDEIVPVTLKSKKGDLIFDRDEFPKNETTAESLAKLRSAFKESGTVTAGNASGINDGASAILIMSSEKAKELGVKPLAKLISFGKGGVDPQIMGTGPIPATLNALEKADLSIDQIDLFEANEAFAAQAYAVAKELHMPAEKVNINGGAISLGHPIGASGNRILVTLLYAMKKRHAKYGLATLCIGGGQGVAAVVENLT